MTSTRLTGLIRIDRWITRMFWHAGPMAGFSLLGVAGAAIIASETQGNIIVDNGTPVDGADLGYSDPDAQQIVAEDFTLVANDTVRSIIAYGSYFGAGTAPVADNFSVNFYGDLAGIPDSAGLIGSSALTVVSRVDTGLTTLFDTVIFRYELNLEIPPSFAAGTVIWMSLFNDTSGGLDPDDNWTWTEVERAGNAAISVDGGGSWSGTNSLLHFQLSNRFVPAPSGLVLLGVLGLNRRRSRRYHRR